MNNRDDRRKQPASNGSQAPAEPETPGTGHRDSLGDSRRRELITHAAAGGGLSLLAGAAAKWRTPIVEGVILPAHAQTSLAVSFGDPCQVELTNEGGAGTAVKVEGNLTGPADQLKGVNGTVMLTVENCFSSQVYSNSVNVTTNSIGHYTANFTVLGPNSIFFTAVTTFPGVGSITCSNQKKACV